MQASWAVMELQIEGGRELIHNSGSISDNSRTMQPSFDHFRFEKKQEEGVKMTVNDRTEQGRHHTRGPIRESNG